MTQELRTKDSLSSWPERIYLQRDEYCVGEECGPHGSETTWSADRINDGDVEYVRADIANRLREQLRRARSCMEANDPTNAREIFGEVRS